MKKTFFKLLIYMTENWKNSLFVLCFLSVAIKVLLFKELTMVNININLIAFAIMFPVAILMFNTKKEKEDRRKFIEKLKDSLDNYLSKQASQDLKKRVATVFVFIDEPNSHILAY